MLAQKDIDKIAADIWHAEEDVISAQTFLHARYAQQDEFVEAFALNI